MTGTAIVSLDCEGRWGVADHLTDQYRQALTDDRLRFAYRSICGLLDKYEVPATFAFVGGFTLNRDTADLDALRDFARMAPEYIGPILDEIETEEGWFGEWALDMVPSQHEIGLHGATHLPWGGIDVDTARRELALLETMPRVAGATTYVFPRNQVNHVSLLHSIGIQGWRESRPMPPLQSLASEFNPFTPSDAAGESIPAGRFINWRSGMRRLVPVWLSRRRARHILRHAAQTGGTAHFWSHPENVASAPQTLATLEAVLCEIAAFQKRGLVKCLTQQQYVESTAQG